MERDMGKEIGVAANLVRAHKLSQERGILALRQFAFESEELRWMTNLVFDLLNKNISPSQIYEILQNYGDDFEEKRIHKLIVNGLMCIIGGESRCYLIELLASIIGIKGRDAFLHEIADILQNENGAEQLTAQKYLEKAPFSANTDISEEDLQCKEAVKYALSQMNSKEVKGILIGVSGKSAQKLIDVIDPFELKLIEEEVLENVSEQFILDARNKLLHCLQNDISVGR